MAHLRLVFPGTSGQQARCDRNFPCVTTSAAAPAADDQPQTGTTTVRIALATKQAVLALADDGESINDTLSRVVSAANPDTRVSRNRDRIAAYLRTHLVKNFGDEDEVTAGEELWRELAALQYPGDPDTTRPTGVVLDHTALGALASGRRLLAQLLHTQPHRRHRHVFAPAQAVYTAHVQYPGLADHLDRLDAVDDIAFDLKSILVVGKQIAGNVTPAVAHVVHAAHPSKAWPTGRPVLTLVPAMYQPYGVQIRALPNN